MCIIVNGYRGSAVRIFKYGIIVNGNIEREIAVNFILIFCLNVKFVTIRNKSFASPTVSLVCEDRALLVGVDLHVAFRRQQHPKCERAVRLVYPPSFCEIRCFIQPHKPKYNRLRCGDLKSRVSVTIQN
jgi:hypothetical protein